MHKMLPTVNPHPFHSENKEARLIHNSHIHSNDSQANCRIASHCCKVVGSILEKSSMVHAFFFICFIANRILFKNNLQLFREMVIIPTSM